MFRCLRFVFLIILFFGLNIHKGFAVDYFFDDFSYRDDTKWNFYCDYPNKTLCNVGSTNVIFTDGFMTLNIPSKYPNFPVVVSNGNLFPKTGDFSVGIKFAYPSVTDRGVGLGIGFTGFGGELFSQFGIWRDTSSGDGFKFYYNDFGFTESQGYCSDFTNTIDTLGRQTKKNVNLSASFWHLFEIFKKGQKYYIYLDRLENSDPIFTAEINYNCIPNIIWFGNFVIDSGGAWTAFSLDSIRVSDVSVIDPTPTPTPTETPTPTPTNTPTLTPTPVPPKKKIFILPGLGASWNSKAIVYNQQVNDNAWKMTPFVNNYDGLIEILEKNELIRDEDFFVWNYDWRKSISEIENKFNSFLESKNISENDEIYLVGHSLGGVVARLWGQDHKDDRRLKNIITLGSPHLGSLDSYSVWNGGKVVDSKGISSVAFQILLNLQNKGLVPNLTKTRNYAPVVKDLLPTSENYVLKNGRYLSQSSLETKNDFLMNKNNEVSRISDKLQLSIGIGFSTPNLVKLGDRTMTDKILGLWPDGKLIGYSYNVGDGTVLKNSASFGSTNLLELNSNHGEIVNNSLDFIISNLGLENKNINFIYNDNFSDSLVIFVGSPATVSVKCGNDTYVENDGFVVIKNKKYNECDLNLSPTDNGIVHLVMGNTNNSDWNYIEKNVTLNNSEKVFIDFNKGDIKIDKRNKNFLMSWIKSDLKLLGLDKAIKFLDRGNFRQVINMVFAYRWKTRETIISQRILDNLFNLGSINGPNKRFYNYNWMYMHWNFLGKIMRKNYFSIMSFNKLGEIVDFSKNKNYPNEEIMKSLSDGYNSEILGN